MLKKDVPKTLDSNECGNQDRRNRKKKTEEKRKTHKKSKRKQDTPKNSDSNECRTTETSAVLGHRVICSVSRVLVALSSHART